MKIGTKIIIGLFSFLLFMSIVSYDVYGTEPTQQFNKIFLDPFYRQNMDQDIDYNYTITIDPSDGFSGVESAIITFQLWLNPTIEFFLEVNGQTCNTASYEVHTTYAGAGEGTIYFDCSNVITEAGTYIVTLTPDDDTGAITGWLDITYENKPIPELVVHGTEYLPGARAKLWVQLLNETNGDVSAGACEIDIYDPTGGTFLENGAMTNMNHDGIYYYDLIAPNAQGVYPAIAKCYYDVSQDNEFADAFILYTGNPESLDYTKTWVLDGNEQKIKQSSGKLDFEYVIDDMCGLDIPSYLLSGVTLSVNVKWKDSVTNDNLVLHWYNFSSGNWIEFPNRIIDPNDRITVTNKLIMDNLTIGGLVNSSGSMRVRINDTLPTQGGDKKVEFDWLQVSCDQFVNPNWVEVKGSGEMHVSSEHYWVIDPLTIWGNVTNENYLGYMYFNFIVSSQSSQDEEDIDVHHILPVPFPCYHVLNVSIDGVDTEWTGAYSGDESCEVHWEMLLEEEMNYDIIIKTENWWKLQTHTWNSEADMINGYINNVCEKYKNDNNYPDYIIPKNQSLHGLGYDDFYISCAHTLDYYYRFNKTLEEQYLFDEAIFTYKNIQELNADWVHLIDVKINYFEQTQAIINAISLATDLSITSLTVDTPVSYMEYWSNISSSWLSYIYLSNETPIDIWSYVNRTLTEDVALSNDSLADVSNQVWNYDNRTLSTFEFDVVNETGIAESVWDWSGFINTNILSQLNRTVNIWSYVSRTLTSFGFDVVDEQEVSDIVWNNSNRTLTTFDFDVVDEQEVSDFVWNNTNRTLSTFEFDTTDEASIWSYVNRTLTNFNFFIPVNAPQIAEYIWNSSNRSLTSLNFDTTDEAEVWNYFNRTLTEFGFDVTNEELIGLNVWNSSNRELTQFIFDVTDEESVWNYTNRTLSEFGFDTVNEEDIWNYNNRTLSTFIFDVVDEQLVGFYVWNSTSREMTAFNFDVVDESLVSDNVWNNSGRYVHGILGGLS